MPEAPTLSSIPRGRLAGPEGGAAVLVAGYSDAGRAVLLAHAEDPQTLLLSPNGTTVARVAWF